ncbi:hypothetical protein C8R46DRAFT_1320848 [Mycena filopes]|nr:hypothetical protein C8R46DRAFT_1320848 [Mycena filopes]
MSSGAPQPKKNLVGTRSYRSHVPVDPNPHIPAAPPRLRAEKQTAEQKQLDKFGAIEKLLKDWPFDTIGDFLAILFYNKPRDEPDPRGTTHAHAVAQFLRGRSNIKMSTILPLMYHHKASFPNKKSPNKHERQQVFATSGPADQSNHARPFMSTWATRLVAAEARKQVGRATRDDPERPDEHARFRAQSNQRTDAQTVTWPALLANFSLAKIHTKYSVRLPLAIFLTEAMAAPSSKGKIFIRKRRPHPIIQVGAIASFILSRNRYANGDLAMTLGVWHFACKAHVDLKRVYCRFGYAVSDTTARNALNSMSDAALKALREEIAEAAKRGERSGALLLDNCQEYCEVYEQGIGRKSELKVGTAGTWVRFDDCAPDAFHAKPYYDKVAQQERKTLTTDSLFDSIDWDHILKIIPLQWVRALVEFVPELHHLLPEINRLFREDYAKRRMRADRKTSCQPLGTNGEHSTETPGMRQAVKDFDNQTGIDSDEPGDLLSWIRGDGASFAAVLNLINLSTPIGTFKNKVATPEIWHTGSTELNSTSANHYGPASSNDPSSLSKCSNIAGFKRPSNVKSCDYYPTVRNLTLIWTAKVLDCWRIHLKVEDLQDYYRDLARKNEVPTVINLLCEAMALVDRYTTQAAIQASLSSTEATDPERLFLRVPVGTPWVAPTTADDVDIPELVDIVEPDTPPAPTLPPQSTEDAPKVHKEKDGFTGDRVLRNSQIFLQDFGWFIEFAHAVPEGDIGRVWEIMKIWIFKFAGSSHQNYMNYLLEVYCMLRYEASKSLSDAILDNWLLNIKGELGRWLPADLHQEHYNKWLEEMLKKHGGEFDSKFYRRTISPCVQHFLDIKEEVETAFDFTPRGQTHTSPHLRPELHLLLTAFKEEEVHLFRSGRSLGHAAVNQFARGWRRLEEDKLAGFLDRSTAVGDFLADIRGGEDRDNEMRSPSPSSSEPRDDSSSLRDVSSPTPSIPRSDVSTRSSDSMRSLAEIDPNEPEDDGEDLSNAQLSSGIGEEAQDEDEGSDEEEEEDDEVVESEEESEEEDDEEEE